MKRVALAFLCSALWAQSSPAAAPAAQIETFTSPADTATSTHFVIADGEVLVIDTQFVNSDGMAAIEKARSLPGKVKKIWITHAHPDHFLQLPRWLEAFPDAKVYAHPKTVAVIKAAGSKMLQGVGAAMGAANFPTTVAVPQEHSEPTLSIGKTTLEIVELSGVESDLSTALYHRPSGSLFAGDALYNNVHLWLKDVTPQTWEAALDQQFARFSGKDKVKTLYPGHGKAGNYKAVYAWNRGYLKMFGQAAAGCKRPDDLEKAVLGDKKFGAAGGKFIVKMAATSGLYCGSK